MDVKYINPFLSAIHNIFSTMIDVPFTIEKPGMKNGSAPDFEISGIIGLSGDVSGVVVINLSEAIALQLASCLLGEEIQELDEDCTDAIGEIANMVAGNAKNNFPNPDTSISVPSVVIGKHKIKYPTGIPIITIPCKTDRGAFIVDIALKAVS
ncbi:MAG: chemotaxis protein CheX [Desulfobacterales bacterium]